MDSNVVFDEERADWRLAHCVVTGMRLSLADGITQALDFMVRSGVPRQVAMRVLSGPRFVRQRDRDYLHTGLASH